MMKDGGKANTLTDIKQFIADNETQPRACPTKDLLEKKIEQRRAEGKDVV